MNQNITSPGLVTPCCQTRQTLSQPTVKQKYLNNFRTHCSHIHFISPYTRCAFPNNSCIVMKVWMLRANSFVCASVFELSCVGDTSDRAVYEKPSGTGFDTTTSTISHMKDLP